MARHKMGFRKTLRQQLEDANAADRYYAAMSGREPQNQSVIAPKRERAAPVQREGAVLRDVLDFLYKHPLTLFVCRQNSGSASYEAKSGRYAPVKFYDIIKRPEKMRIVDVWGFLVDGRPYAIETKAPGWKRPTDDREIEQAAFLDMILSCGGVALFCTDVSQVAEALDAR